MDIKNAVIELILDMFPNRLIAYGYNFISVGSRVCHNVNQKALPAVPLDGQQLVTA